MQAAPYYPGSCGRCFEVKCRPAQVTSASGNVNLDRSDACLDPNKSIIIQIVDTCPCNGNEQWCCGDQPHFDLGRETFRRVRKKSRRGGKLKEGKLQSGEYYSYARLNMYFCVLFCSLQSLEKVSLVYHGGLFLALQSKIIAALPHRKLPKNSTKT